MDIETNNESKRKLASIQIVDRVDPHNNADTLELATVLGWQIVTRIGEAKAGDLVVYCEIDSILPKADWLPDAIKQKIQDSNSDSFRLKTVKLRGEISQGLIVPLVASMPFDITKVSRDDIGRNVTQELCIVKYEAQSSINYGFNGNVKRFPTHLLSKTDEERIQSSPKLLEKITGQSYYITVKCDGTSATYFLGPETLVKDDGDTSVLILIVCSRNQIRSKPETEEDLAKDPYWRVALNYNIEEKLRTYVQNTGENIAIQCEICGPNIQLNLLGLKQLEPFVFNVVDLRVPGGRLVSFTRFLEVTSTLGLQTVPIEEHGDVFKPTTVKELLLKAEGKYPKSNKHREGLVFRTQDSTVSFKVINNQYLLKTGQ